MEQTKNICLSSGMTILLSNAEARRIFLARQGLSAPPGRLLGKEGLLQLIHDIGFVQVDSIATVERAHHQILFSRNQTYRREHLTELLEEDGDLFEHWTHDASIIPSTFFRYWKHRFRRKEASILERWSKWQGEGFDRAFEETYERIAASGAVLSRELKSDDEAARAQALKEGNTEGAAALGFAGALGAYGGFFIPKSYGSSIAATGGPEFALWMFAVFYVLCIIITWWYYSRKHA